MAQKNGQMSKTERAALIRIVRNRFKMLQDGLYLRQHEVQRAVEMQIDADHADLVGEFVKKSATLISKLNALIGQLEDLKEEGEGRGVKASFLPSRVAQPKWVPDRRNKLIDEKLAEIGGLNGRWEYQLKQQENDLIEELLLGDIASDSAHDFLSKIPTPEHLIPLPPGVKEIANT